MPDHDDDLPPQHDDIPWASLEDEPGGDAGVGAGPSSAPSRPSGPPSGPSPAPPLEPGPLDGHFEPSLTPEQQSMQAARAAWVQSRPKAGSVRTGPLPLHPMTLSDILDGAFKLYKANFRAVLIVSACFVAPVQVVAAFLQRDLYEGGIFNDPFALEAAAEEDNGTLAAGLLAGLATVLVMPLVAGAISRIVGASYLGEDLAAGEAIREVGRRWWVYVVAWILVHIIEGLMLILLILPGLIAMAWYVPVAPIIAVEGLGPRKAMRRSRRLVKPRMWAVMGVAIVSGLLATAVGGALGFVPQMAGLIVGGDLAWIPIAVGSVLSTVVSTPFVAIVATLVYFDARIRQEGLDLEIMAADLARGAETA